MILVRTCHVNGGVLFRQARRSSRLPLGRNSYTKPNASRQEPIKVTSYVLLHHELLLFNIMQLINIKRYVPVYEEMQNGHHQDQ
uniref:Uncharacterized protein n=1 Tax=Oryza meridionalis TaxID=40149 RepID=A0A0E0CPH7_9ORYZ